MTVSVMPTAFGGVGAAGTLALTNLQSTHNPFSGNATAGVRVNTNENVEELVNGASWVAQNAGTEWIDDLGGASASDYEVQMDTGTLFGTATLSGPARGQYWTLSVIRSWELDALSAFNQQGTFSSTLRIREKANTSNNVSASVFLQADATGI